LLLPKPNPNARIRELETALAHQRQLNEVYRRRVETLQEQLATAWRFHVRTDTFGR
jgi:hypothetical protein